MAVSERREELWHRWWFWAIPVAWAATGLVLAAEEFRLAGWSSTGDLLDVVRLAIYWFWCRLAWECAGNAGNPFWTLLSKGALAGGLVVTVLT